MVDEIVGRVRLSHGRKKRVDSSNGVNIGLNGTRARVKYRMAGYHPYENDPISNWRPCKFMKKGARRPRRFRVRLKEAVAREAREIQTTARQYSASAMKLAAEIMGDPTEPASARLQAMDLILNRAYGRPNQNNTNLNIDANGKTEEISSTELDTRTAAALKQFEKLTGGTAKAAAGKKQPADIREHHRNPDGSEPQLN